LAHHKATLNIASGIDRKTGQYQTPYLQLKYMPLTIGGRRPKRDIQEIQRMAAAKTKAVPPPAKRVE
jgi:hypothetical protein